VPTQVGETPVKAILCAMALLGLLVTGCASDPPHAQADQSNDSTAATTGSGKTGQVAHKAGDKEFKGTVSEYARKFVACLRGEGWDVELAPEGDGYLSHVSADQGTAFNTARDTCSKKIGTAPARGKVSHAEMVALYEFAQGTVECLRSHGWPATDPPSLDTFIQQNFFTKGVSYEPLWSAYDLVAKDPTLTAPTKWREINQTCPQGPK